MVRVIIPFKLQNPKTRLSNVLSIEERAQFVKNMLFDVLDVAVACSSELFILSTIDIDFIDQEGVKVIVDPRSLNGAINSILDDKNCQGIDTAIIMSDLPLLNVSVLERFLSTEGDVVIAPGKKGGTNMLLIRDSIFRTSYHYGSFFKHLEIARKIGIQIKVFDSFFASIDIDEEDDILELMLHGKGRSRSYLHKLGFKVDFCNKDPVLMRD